MGRPDGRPAISVEGLHHLECMIIASTVSLQNAGRICSNDVRHSIVYKYQAMLHMGDSIPYSTWQVESSVANIFERSIKNTDVLCRAEDEYDHDSKLIDVARLSIPNNSLYGAFISM